MADEKDAGRVGSVPPRLLPCKCHSVRLLGATMKRYTFGCLLLACATLLAGCEAYRSQVPVPVTHKADWQFKMQSAGHWQVLAGDVADRILKAIGDRDDLLMKPLYVQPPNSRPFAMGFYKLLTSELVSRGMQVSLNRERDVVDVEFDVLSILHSSRAQRPPIGTFTSIAAGISVARALDSMAEWIPAAIGAGVLADFASGAITGVSNHEMLISVSMSYNNRYVVHTSSVYYINDPDFEQYVDPLAPGHFVQEFRSRPVRVTSQ